jgi:hypothetical protein
MRRSTVLSLPLQLVFPGQGFESSCRERERERERGKEEILGSCFTDALNENGNVQKYDK